MPLARRNQERISTVGHAGSSSLRFDRRSISAYEQPYEFQTDPAKRCGLPHQDHVPVRVVSEVSRSPLRLFRTDAAFRAEWNSPSAFNTAVGLPFSGRFFPFGSIYDAS